MRGRLQIVILAAGSGTRMQSSQSKVLHSVAGKPLLWHVLNTAVALKPAGIHIIHGAHSEQLQQTFADYPFKLNWVHQSLQCGTGDAVKQVLPFLSEEDTLLTLYGDMPLITPDCLQRLLAVLSTQALGVLTAKVADPFGLGRIVRDESGKWITQIVEEKDIQTAAVRAIDEINTGVLAGSAKLFKQYLPVIDCNNAQQEYLLTDLIALVQSAYKVLPVLCNDPKQASGVNTRAQLACAERDYQDQQAKKLMENGVSLIDPKRIDIRGQVCAENDVCLDVNVILEGDVTLRKGCYIEPNVIIRNSTIGKHVRIKANSVIEGAVIGDHAQVGPFARIRPETHLGENTHVGNFVELKKTTMGAHSKAGHLTYLGDAKIGEHTNIGAGTITCNYDGANKAVTKIGNHVFLGSNTLLRAPVTIGDHATTGAGTVVRRDVKVGQLSLTWQEQQHKDNWVRPKKS